MTGEPLSARLSELARRIGRLSPPRHDPNKFFEERSELEHEARRMAREVS